jgi:hypothetical protein
MAGDKLLGNLLRALPQGTPVTGALLPAEKDTAQLWGVTFEDTDKASIIEFTERLGISFRILGHGEDPLTGYGEVRLLPTTFLINPGGLFQHRFEGPTTAQNITYEIERVR